MYYDRSLPQDFIQMLGQSLLFRDLVALANSSWGAEMLAHIELRRSNSQSKRGSVQLYLGRSSLLEILAKINSLYTLSAHAKYKKNAPDLFDRRFSPTELDSMTDAVKSYLQAASGSVGEQFTEGEGRVHAGFVRRYGSKFLDGDPLVAVDKEVRVGFANRAESNAFRKDLRKQFGEIHQELDTIAVLADGTIGIIELKKENESVKVAALQAASHVYIFNCLVARRREQEPEFDFSVMLNRLINQKVSLGLLPKSALRAEPGAALVPIVAAPDRRENWLSLWLSGLQKVCRRQSDLLEGLQLWRLSKEGHVKEIEVA